MNKQLIRDVAADITRGIIERIRWEREEQMVEAFEEFFPVVCFGIEEYEVSRMRSRRTRVRRKRLGRDVPDQSGLKPEGEADDNA